MPTCPQCKHTWSARKKVKLDTSTLVWEELDPKAWGDKPTLRCKVCNFESALAVRPRYERVCGKCLWEAQVKLSGRAAVARGEWVTVAEALASLREKTER